MSNGHKTKKEMWITAIKVHCDKKGIAFKIPKKGTADYIAVKKIYDASVKYFIKHVDKDGPK